MLLSENEINDTFRWIRAQEWTAGGIALLNIGEQETTFSVQPQGRGSSTLRLQIGTKRTSGEFFRHEPPTPEEVEAAINFVEDEVTRAVSVSRGALALYTKDLSARGIAGLADLRGEGRVMLGRSQMEAVFGRLAALSMGRPVSSDTIPVDASFSASLLILREVMHHLGFEYISII